MQLYLASLQYSCPASIPEPDNTVMQEEDEDEDAVADYCENVLGYKYSWGYEHLVPGCTGCRCCKPQKISNLLIFINSF